MVDPGWEAQSDPVAIDELLSSFACSFLFFTTVTLVCIAQRQFENIAIEHESGFALTRMLLNQLAQAGNHQAERRKLPGFTYCNTFISFSLTAHSPLQPRELPGLSNDLMPGHRDSHYHAQLYFGSEQLAQPLSLCRETSLRSRDGSMSLFVSAMTEG